MSKTSQKRIQYYTVDFPAFGQQAVPGTSAQDAALKFILKYGKIALLPAKRSSRGNTNKQ